MRGVRNGPRTPEGALDEDEVGAGGGRSEGGVLIIKMKLSSVAGSLGM
jgi:hypothetical protein